MGDIPIDSANGRREFPHLNRMFDDAGTSGAKMDVPLKTNNANGTLNSNDARVQKALEMRKNGASPSQVYAETGLLQMANGNLKDGVGSPVVWSDQNGAGPNSGNTERTDGGAGQRGSEAEGHDGRGTDRPGMGDPSGRGTGEVRRAWGDLTENDRRTVVELVREHTGLGVLHAQRIESSFSILSA